MVSIIILTVSSLLGAVFSGILIEHHVNPATESEFLKAVCGTGSESGCDRVNTFEISKFLGLPIAFWGFLYYAVVFLLIIFYLKLKEITLIQFIFWASVLALLIDILLLIYSLIIIEAVCNLCVITYFLTIGILLSSGVILKKHQKTLFNLDIDLKSLISNSAVFISMVSGFILIVFIGVFILLYARASSPSITGKSNPDSILNEAWEAFKRQYENEPLRDFSTRHSASKGASEPILTIVEFADFLCPHCKHIGEELKHIAEKYPKSIKVVFKHYPLDQECNQNIPRKFHEGACQLAYISQCALKEQPAAFWNMHDMIFKFQKRILSAGSLNDSEMNTLIRSAGLNVNTIRSCVRNPQIKSQIRQDIEEGDKAGVKGTPSLYINNRKVPTSNINFFIEKLLTYQVKKGIE